MKDPVLIDEFYHQRELDADRALEELRSDEEEETLEDRESRARLALLYAEEHATTVPTLPYREWRRDRVLSEMRPQWEGGWSK